MKKCKYLYICSVMSNSLQPHELQQDRLPYPSLYPRAYSNLCSMSQWCHPTISSVIPFSSCLLSFLAASSSHQLAKVLELQLPKQSFQWIFTVDFLEEWLVWPLGQVSFKGHSESSPTPQFKCINSSVLSLLYGLTLTSIHDHWKNHSFDYTDLCQQSNASAFQYTV